MSMDLFGEVAGRIGFEGGGGGVADVKVKTSSDYASVVNPEDKTAYIDLSECVKESEMSEYVTSDGLTLILANYVTSTSLSNILNDYVTDSELSNTLSNYVTDSELSTELTSYQPKLTAGENITIENNVISANGGGGGGFDLPTDGTPVAIGTFGNQTIYMQYFTQSLVGTTSGTRNVWQGQSGDMVISCSCIAYPNDNPPTKAVVPYSRSNQATFNWIDNEYEALPTIAVNYSLENNLWTRNSATLKGCVIFIR